MHRTDAIRMTNTAHWGKKHPVAWSTAPHSHAGAQWIAPQLRQKPQDLPHNRAHLPQLVAIEANQWMGAGAGQCPLAPAQPRRPSLDHRWLDAVIAWLSWPIAARPWRRNLFTPLACWLRLPQVEMSCKGISNGQSRAATRASLEWRSRPRPMLPHSRWSTTASCGSTASRARKQLGVAAESAASRWRSPSASDREAFHRPASGPGQGGAEGTWRRIDALPQLAAEAEGGSGSESREGTWNRGNLPSTKPYVRRVRSESNTADSII